MNESVVLAFLAAVFAVPGAASVVTSVLRRVTDGLGVDPRVVLYVVAYAIAGGVLAQADLPEWAGDPFAYVTLWGAVATATAEMARRLYDAILSHLPGLSPA